MRPFTAAALGITTVAVDFRLDAVDLLPDPIGWALIGYAAFRLATPALGWLAALAGVCSLAEVALPYHYRQIESFSVTPGGSTRIIQVEVLELDALTGVRLAASALTTIALGIVLVGLVVRVRNRATPADQRSVRGLRVLAAATVGIWVIPHLVGMAAAVVAGHGFDPVWNDPAWRLELAGLVAALAFAAGLAREAREPWALPPGRLRIGNWSRPTAHSVE